MDTGINHTERNLERQRSGSSFGNVLLGLIAGAVAGAAAGLLFAPRSGEETQTEIRRRGEELRDQAEHKLELGRERATDSVRQARLGVVGWLKQGSEMLEKQADQLQENNLEERVLAS